MSAGYNTVNLHTGTKAYVGLNIVTKGNHNRMPAKDSSYLATDERGHIQASSLSGDNSIVNIAPQAKDLNHGAYLSVENGEKDALARGNTIETEKVAFSSNQLGHRPDAFVVNDTVTMANGQQQEIHHSFANMQNSEQESLNTGLDRHSDMLDAPNPGDTLKDGMSSEEYAELMEVTDNELIDLRDEYQVDEYVSVTDFQGANDMWVMTGDEFEVEDAVDASNEWEMVASNEVDINDDFSAGADLSADME